MDLPGRKALLQSVQHVCVQHGFEREDFICLIEATYGTKLCFPEQASQALLQQFLITSLKWACPPHTPVMEARRTAAMESWLSAAEDSLPAAA